MAPSLLYCSVCGAANAPDDDACFACKRPLALLMAENRPTRLLHRRYQVLAQVGTGGFGAVYKALDTQAQDRRVALKQINLRGLTPQQVIEATDSFNREVHMLSTLNHAHLPRIHAHFTDPDHWYVAMDFIDGETLEYYLRDITSADENAIRALVLDEVLDIALQLCNVLAYLHTQQPPIIFRDLKPANIMRTPQGRLYLIDFGIARYFTPGQVRDTIPLGSPGYAAPEQYGRAQTTPRADIYSLGALLHHLLSRHDPAETPFSFAPLRLADPTDLSELTTLVARMVEQDVELRPETIGTVESTLLRIRNQRAAEPRIWRPVPPGKAAPPPVPARGAYQPAQVRQQLALRAAARKKSRRRFLVGGLTVASALTLGGSIGGFSYWRSWHPASLDLEAGFPRQLPTPESEVTTSAWSPDGQHVAFGLSAGSIVGNHFSNKTSMNITSAFSFKANPDTLAQPVTVLAWSPDNRLLAAASRPGQLGVWNISLQRSQTIPIGGTMLKLVAWSPDNQHIAVIDDQGGVFFCNLQIGTSARFISQTAPVSNALAWSPDGQRVAIESTNPANTYSNSLKICNVGTGEVLASLSPGTPTIQALAWSPDGQYLAGLSVDGTLQVWTGFDNISRIFSQQLSAGGALLAWSPDSRFLATIDYANNLLLLDRSNGSTLVSAFLADPLGRGGVFSGNALAWLPDSQHIAIASNNMECWLWTLSWF